MLFENVPLRRARALITHKRFTGCDEHTGLPTYEVLGQAEGFNLITDAGRVTLHTYLYGANVQRAGLGAGLNYVGISDDSNPPVAGDTALAGELSGDGLTRFQAIVQLPVGAENQTFIQRDFLYTGGVLQGVRKTALFDAPTAGNMAHEILFTPFILDTNDLLTIQFTIQVG